MPIDATCKLRIFVEPHPDHIVAVTGVPCLCFILGEYRGRLTDYNSCFSCLLRRHSTSIVYEMKPPPWWRVSKMAVQRRCDSQATVNFEGGRLATRNNHDAGPGTTWLNSPWPSSGRMLVQGQSGRCHLPTGGSCCVRNSVALRYRSCDDRKKACTGAAMRRESVVLQATHITFPPGNRL
jgi:hypothetical protein